MRKAWSLLLAVAAIAHGEIVPSRAFSQIGVRRGVELTTVDGGKQRRIFISSNDPEALAGAITRSAGVESG